MSVQPVTNQPDSSTVRMNAPVPNFTAVTTFGEIDFFDVRCRYIMKNRLNIEVEERVLGYPV